MGAPLDGAFRTAVRAVVCSVGDLAHRCGYSRITFDTYLNRRSVSKAAAVALAAEIERQESHLRELRLSLLETVDEESASGD